MAVTRLSSVLTVATGCHGHSYSAPDWFCVSSSKWPNDVVFRMLTCTYNEASASCWKVDI